MSVSAQNTRIVYAGDGSTTVFSIPFALPSDSDGTDIAVYVVDDLGNVTLLTSNYVVDVNAKTVTYPTVGGVSPLLPGVNAVPVGWELVLLRAEPLSQNLQLTNQGLFSLPAIESALDYLMYCVQQMQEQLNRATLLPVNIPVPSVYPVSPTSAGSLVTLVGTYAAIKALVAINPTTMVYGWATDLGVAGQLMFYCGNPSVGDGGWFGPLAGE